MYDVKGHTEACAKIQPSRTSKHWEEGYDQNELEHDALMKLQAFPGTPRVLSYNPDMVHESKSYNRNRFSAFRNQPEIGQTESVLPKICVTFFRGHIKYIREKK